MKQIALVPLVVVVAACASHAPKTTPTASTAPMSHNITDPSGIRLAEQIREYRSGRYVDPGDPLMMHDAHPVYRIEQTAAWNLRPATRAPSGRSSPASRSPGTTQRDAELVELNKQRAATRAFTEQAATLNQRLAEFTEAIAQTQEIAKQNLLLKQEIDSLRERLDTLQKQSGQAQPDAVQRPSPQDDKW
jgi:hypothetical protein